MDAKDNGGYLEVNKEKYHSKVDDGMGHGNVVQALTQEDYRCNYTGFHCTEKKKIRQTILGKNFEFLLV